MLKQTIEENHGDKGRDYTQYVLTEQEYQEYQDLKSTANEYEMKYSLLLPKYEDLKEFKANCDKDIKEWDKGICVHKELYVKKGKISFCKNCDKVIATATPIDQETQEDIEDLYNDNKILHDILADHKRVQDIMKTKIADLEDANMLLDDMVYDDLAPDIRAIKIDAVEKYNFLGRELDKLTDIINKMSESMTVTWTTQQIKDMNIIRRLGEVECEINANSDTSGSTTKRKPGDASDVKGVGK
jgi:hypothetical protein